MKLDTNTRKWIWDRLQNREPLWWNDFVRFMRDHGADNKTIRKYRTISYKKSVNKLYTKEKKSSYHRHS